MKSCQIAIYKPIQLLKGHKITMSERFILAVGDKFSHFGIGKDVITLSQLKAILGMPKMLIANTGRVIVIPGQGLGDDDVEDILSLAAGTPDCGHFDFSLWHRLPKRASRMLSHKVRPENTLISEPRQIDEDIFELDLLIDEDCELMSDHQSGQHLQGMILVEAARQSLLAVTEAFFLPQDGSRFAFVFNDMSISYANFAFPLDARLRYVIKAKDIRGTKRLQFDVEITIEQCGVTSATFASTFTAFEEHRIASKEGADARKTFELHMSLEAARRTPAIDVSIPMEPLRKIA